MSLMQRWRTITIVAVTMAWLSIGLGSHAVAQRIDFENLTSGTSLFGFDVNADGVNDVRFTSLLA